jgi:hypothetical protein
MFSVILRMLRQTVDNRAPRLPFPSFSPLTVTFPKLAVILRPLYVSVAMKSRTHMRQACSYFLVDGCLGIWPLIGGLRVVKLMAKPARCVYECLTSGTRVGVLAEVRMKCNGA